MRIRSISTFIVAVAATLTIAACASESAVAPQAASTPPAASGSLLGGLLGTTTQTITPLLRTAPIASQTTSAKIGALGGTLSLPGAGVTIVVPPLAVTTTQTITVTAVAGSNVAYEFQPHGLKFLVPLVMTQSLVGTQAQAGGLLNPLSLKLGYYPDATHITSVSELLDVNVDLLGQTAAVSIWHFSGYIFAGGRTDEM